MVRSEGLKWPGAMLLRRRSPSAVCWCSRTFCMRSRISLRPGGHKMLHCLRGTRCDHPAGQHEMPIEAEGKAAGSSLAMGACNGADHA